MFDVKLREERRYCPTDAHQRHHAGRVANVFVQFFPPKTPEAAETLYQTIRDLESYMPDFVSVTYGAGGSTRELTHDLVERINTRQNWTRSRILLVSATTKMRSKRFCSDTQRQPLEIFSRSAVIDTLEWLTIKRVTRSSTRLIW